MVSLDCNGTRPQSRSMAVRSRKAKSDASRSSRISTWYRFLINPTASTAVE
jgi:hypothetical protein